MLRILARYLKINPLNQKTIDLADQLTLRSTPKKSGKVKCRISQGSYKNVIGVEELVDEKFEGSCILRIYQAYVGSCKSISLSVEEILARKIGIRESYFADESDESDEESDEEP